MPLCRVRIISSHNYLIHQKYIFLQVVFHLLAIFFVGPKQKKSGQGNERKPVRHGPFFIYAKEMALIGKVHYFENNVKSFFKKKFAIHSERTLGLPD